MYTLFQYAHLLVNNISYPSRFIRRRQYAAYKWAMFPYRKAEFLNATANMSDKAAGFSGLIKGVLLNAELLDHFS